MLLSRGNVKNLGTFERIARLILGGALGLWSLSQFLGSYSVFWRTADLALVALGLDLVLTGIRGYCPLYKWLGWNTTNRRERV